MYRSVPWLIVALLVSGCSRSPAPRPKKAVVPAAPARPAINLADASVPISMPAPQLELAPAVRQNDAIVAAIGRLLNARWNEALELFRRLPDDGGSEAIRAAISSAQLRADLVADGEQTVAGIRAVLLNGNVAQAAELAAMAAQVYVDEELARPFLALKRQADALIAIGMEPAARNQRFRKEAEAALKAGNLRAGALALEQIANSSSDPELRRFYAETMLRSRRYDYIMQRAAEWQRNPEQLEEAFSAYQEAAKQWDTLDVRLAIDDVLLALQYRPESVVVLPFDARGDMAITAKARQFTDGLAGVLKTRFTLADRGAFLDACHQLGVRPADLLVEPLARREISRLSQARFAVLGDVTAVNGVVVRAALVDLRSGGVVQTARICAPTPEEAVAQAPHLGTLLLMNDDARAAYERSLAQQAAQPKLITDPPDVPPDPPASSEPPPPFVAVSLRPLDSTGLSPAAFDRFPAVGATSKPNFQLDHPARSRAAIVAVHLGDNLLQRNVLNEACAKYRIAASLLRDPLQVQSRLDRCRAFAAKGGSGKPRVAIFDFLTPGDDRSGAAMADHLGVYLSPAYRAVPREEIVWTLTQLGLSPLEVATDASARLYLARALDTRFVVFGQVRPERDRLMAAVHWLDAETGQRTAAVQLSAASRGEMRLVVGDLARMLLMSPMDRVRYLDSEPKYQELMAQVRRELDARDLSAAQKTAQAILDLRPGSVRVDGLITDLEELQRRLAIEARRRSASEEMTKLKDAARARQRELLAALQTALTAPATPDALQRRSDVSGQFATQAKTARSGGEFSLAAQFLEAALGLEARDEWFNELAQARILDEAQRQQRAEQDAKARRDALARARDGEVRKIREPIESRRKQRQTAEQARGQAQQDADRREYDRLVSEGRAAQGRGQYDEALFALNTAQRLLPGDEIDRLIAAAAAAPARSAAQRRGERAAFDFDAQQSKDTAARSKIDGQLKRNQMFADDSLRQAERALGMQRYDAAIKLFTESRKHLQSDAAVAGLFHAYQCQGDESSDAAAAKSKPDKFNEAEVAQMGSTGRAAFDAGRFDDALAVFRKAKVLAPQAVPVVAWIARTEFARLDALTRDRRRDAQPRSSIAPTSSQPLRANR